MGGDRSRGGWLRCWVLGAVLAACLVWAAPAQAAPFVYVVDNISSRVSQYDAVGGALAPLAPATVATGQFPWGVAVSPDGKNVYVTNRSGDSVSQYDVGAGGTLTAKTPATVAAPGGPIGIAVSEDGKSVYVTTGDFSNTVSQYDIGAGGALTPKTPASVPAASAPVAVAVSPDGKSVYVINDGFLSTGGSVSQYNIGAGGALTPKTPATVEVGGTPGGVAVSPDGKSVYITLINLINGVFPGIVAQYDVDPLTGALTAKTPASVPAGPGPGNVVLSPGGSSVYVGNFGDDSVSQYDVGTGGVLTSKTPATVPGVSSPEGVAVSPDGKSVYVANYSNPGIVSQYDVGAGGALTAKTPATVAASNGPVGIAVTPLPRVHATATTVSCSPSVFAPGDATVCKATVTDTARAGQTTPTGTVSFTNSGAGRFFGSPCALSGSGASASCAVFFTSFPRGGRIIAAGYGGDATHTASSGFTGVTVAVPASTEGCVVFGHGRITAANGDKASFRGLVAATPPRGVEFYRDNGSANPFRVASTSVDALTCADDATTARVFGAAKVNGAGSVEYRIDVQLAAWEWGNDAYRIRLSNGYDSGAQPIRHGDVDIHIRTSEHHHHDANANRYKPGVGQDGG